MLSYRILSLQNSDSGASGRYPIAVLGSRRRAGRGSQADFEVLVGWTPKSEFLSFDAALMRYAYERLHELRGVKVLGISLTPLLLKCALLSLKVLQAALANGSSTRKD